MSGSSSSGGSQAWSPPSLEELGRLLPQYEIDELLGRGGMGAVYRGRQASLGRPVAIKLLPETLAAMAEADGGDPHRYVERFKLEARSMANLDHPAIVSIYDFGQTEAGHLYFVMEYIDGLDIEQYIQANGGTVDPEHAIAIVSHVLDALDYAHSKGIIHRDIKPANVLLNRDGRVKVADFGLAKALGEDAAGESDGVSSVVGGLTLTDMAMGTPDYIAPEALEHGVTPDHRADLYAVGVMLYKMLTGKLPRGIFQLPSEANAELDPRFDELIAKSMASEPGGRFQSASEFRHRLGRMISEPVTRIEAGTPTESVAPPAERRLVLRGGGAGKPSGVGSASSVGRSGAPARSTDREAPEATPEQASRAALIGGVIAALMLVGGLVFFVVRDRDTGDPEASPGDLLTDATVPDPATTADPDPLPATGPAPAPAVGTGSIASPSNAGTGVSSSSSTPPATASTPPVSASVPTISAPPATPSPPVVPTAPEVDELQIRLDNYRKARRQQVGDLLGSYRNALEREEARTSAQADPVGRSQAQRALATLGAFEPRVMTVLEEVTIAPLPAFVGTTGLVGIPLGLEETFVENLDGIESRLRDQLQTSLGSCETQLLAAQRTEAALQVRAYVEQLIPLLEGQPVQGTSAGADSAVDLMNLALWKSNGEAEWVMQGGAIASDTPQRGHLYLGLGFDEFELTGELYCEAGANGGIGFWNTGFSPAHVQTGGYEFQLAGSASAHQKTGSLMTNKSLVSVGASRVPDGQWVGFRIRATEALLQGWLNGEEVYRFVPLPESERSRGSLLHLQQWGDGGRVGYRNLRVAAVGDSSLEPGGELAEAGAAWEPLFEGKVGELATWEGGNSASWRVAGTEIWKGPGEPRHVYRSLPYREFEIAGEFRTSADGNGGVHVENVAELALVGSNSAGIMTGGIYGFGLQNKQNTTPPENPIEDQTWTPFRLQLSDGRFRTWVDGDPVSELAVSLPSGALRFGLEGIVNRGEVAYRDLRIRPAGADLPDAAVAPASADAIAPESDWVPLADETSLDGWEQGTTSGWTVNAGELWHRPPGKPGTIWAPLPIDAEAFEVGGEFRTTADGNGGVFVENVAELALVGSEGVGSGGVWTGGVFLGSANVGLATPESNPITDDTWTPFRLRWQGGRFETWIDGEKVAEVDRPAPARQPRIGLQGKPVGEVGYRNLRVRGL